MSARPVAAVFALVRPLAAHHALATLLAAGVLMACNAAIAQTESDVTTRSGLVQGRLDAAAGVVAFRGIRYAAPPVGDRRWREPGPAPRWNAPRPALQNGAACPQPRGASLEGGGGVGQIDEDCLTLNVFAPARGPASESRPVMVWLHGGALVMGSGGLPIYDGTALARRGVVVVTVNYRLGHLGFFSHPALERASPGGPVNFGLLDQVAALRWVQDNIENFGGDARRVTLFGQSAGGQGVLALMASPLAQGLFHRAVVQSAYGLPSHTRPKAVAMGAAVAEHAGLPGASASLDELRRLPVDTLLAAQAAKLTLAPSFIVGDPVLPATIVQTFQQGRQAPVPLLIGSNSDEASVAAAFGVDSARLLDQLGRAKVLVGKLHPGVTDDEQLGREVVRDAMFTAYAKRIATLHVAKAPTWRYYFSHRPAGQRSEAGGVGHGGEVPYVHGNTRTCDCLGPALDGLDDAVERRVGDAWADFARTGSLPWERDDRARGFVMEIAANDIARPRFMRARLNAYILAANAVQRGVVSGPAPR